MVVHQPAAPPGGRYVCEDGKLFLVELGGDGSTATVTYDNRTVTLPQTLGGSDVKYSDGRTTLYLDGRALLGTADSCSHEAAAAVADSGRAVRFRATMRVRLVAPPAG
jgi:membrane-bound inhibitor of C-type lysozyme